VSVDGSAGASAEEIEGERACLVVTGWATADVCAVSVDGSVEGSA